MPRRQLSPAATIVAFFLISLATPAVFLFLGSMAERVRAQELGPKQAFVPPTQSSEASTKSSSPLRRTTNGRPHGKVTTSSLPKPSGKMEFVPNSATSRGLPSTAAAKRTSNSVVRRQAAEQPPKIAAKQPKATIGSRTNATRLIPPPAPVVVEEPIQVAKERVFPVTEPVETLEVDQLSEPEMASESVAEVASQVEPPVRSIDRPELPIQEIEQPIVQRTSRPSPMLDEDEVDRDESVPVQTSRELVELDFEEHDGMADKDENMELAEVEEAPERLQQSVVEPAWESEIQNIAAQEKPAQAKPEEQPVTSVAEVEDDVVAPPKDDILAELIHNPVRSIEIRKAVQLPPVAEMENQKLREPADQARAYLRNRPSFKFWPVYRDPWVANRDSYAFHQNPLWFEDPNLERCGRGWGHLTSVKSFVCFSANIPILPYRMTAQPSCSCVRTLPDCTVCEKFGYDAYLPPWSWKAATVQAASVVGFIYMIP